MIEFGFGYEVWMDKGYLVDVMCVFYVFSGIFKLVNINNCWFFDGVIVNFIFVFVCWVFGVDIVIVVNLNNDFYGKGIVIFSYEVIEIEYILIEDESKLNCKIILGKWCLCFFSEKSESFGIFKVMFDVFNII